ncbi:hypothetical protein [Halomontanus rarus]|uniref:hypothetical protein n=1 Tax=Halomontanus rarus TaxID=3034020 RepID=UPI0023E841D0|nr:hypothetical protein [Halovivax sp. TS33]
MEDDTSPALEEQWYWDRRTNKAYYPVAVDGDTVQLATVWHRDEIDGALEAGAWATVEELNPGRTDTTFDLVDSFRMPPITDLAAPGDTQTDQDGDDNG